MPNLCADTADGLGDWRQSAGKAELLRRLQAVVDYYRQVDLAAAQARIRRRRNHFFGDAGVFDGGGDDGAPAGEPHAGMVEMAAQGPWQRSPASGVFGLQLSASCSLPCAVGLQSAVYGVNVHYQRGSQQGRVCLQAARMLRNHQHLTYPRSGR